MSAKKTSKSKGEEREEITLPEPDFDEVEYKVEEVLKGKRAVVDTGLGIFLAAVTVAIQTQMDVTGRIGWAVLGAGLLSAPYLYQASGIKPPEWGFKEIATTGITTFFSFLAFWYIFSNPPFV